jgi:L-iditol 2-dehydrogenase
MRAAVYHGPGDVRLEDVERPQPGPGEVLVEMRACGVCGSDLMDWYVAPRAPLVLGHEPVGIVAEAVGDGLPPVGARVFVHHHVPCLRCDRCRRGAETNCARFKATRIVPGGFAEVILVPAENAALDLLVLPDGVSDAAATAIEPLACCVRGLRRARVAARTRLAVVGGGPMGLLAAQAAQAEGADVVVAEPLEARRALAARLGVPAVPAEAGAVIEALGAQATVVLLCTGAEAAWELGREVADVGAVLQLFAPATPGTRRSFDVNDVMFGELEIQGSYSAGPADTRRALELVASGAVRPDALVTHRFGLDDVAGALAAARAREGGKVIVTSGGAGA